MLAGDTPVLVHNDGGPGSIDWGNPATFDPMVLQGMSPAEIEAAVPSEWERIPSNSGGGMIYRDPNNFGRQIRVMPGYLAGNRADVITHGPYVVVSQNGTKTKVALREIPRWEDADMAAARDWLAQELNDLLDVGSVGLYELLELLRSGEYRSLSDDEARVVSREVAARLVDDHKASICVLSWPSDDVVEGPLSVDVLSEDWAWEQLPSKRYLALIPS